MYRLGIDIGSTTIKMALVEVQGDQVPHRLEKDTHNKTIQKGVESFRITDEQKALLKILRR